MSGSGHPPNIISLESHLAPAPQHNQTLNSCTHYSHSFFSPLAVTVTVSDDGGWVWCWTLMWVGAAQKLGVAVVKWGVLLHCALEYVGDFVICSGPSMEPSLKNHDILLTEHMSARLGKVTRGDIVIARSPTNPTQFICKRVLGLPGDHLLQTDGNLKHIPKGHIWIEGDNSPNSTDSRMYGPIPIGLVRGRALLRLWPLPSAKLS